MALTMVQQCKAWFEAGLDDNIIEMVFSLARDHNFSLDSQAAINLPPSAQRQEQIDALFWLGASQNRQGIKHHDLSLVRSGIELLLPLYSEYCDDLNYFVSLALAFEYLGQYEHSLYYLYEAMGQFPKVAYVDDMIEGVAKKLNIQECDFSFNKKVRAAWQELLNNIPAIKSYLAIVNPSSGEQQLLKDLVAKPFSKICSFFDVQIHSNQQEVYFYLTCHGDESLFIALKHCLSLKREGFPSNWHFQVGLNALGKVELEIDQLIFSSDETWCTLSLADEHTVLHNSRLNQCALALLGSKFNHDLSSNKIEPTAIHLNRPSSLHPNSSDWQALERSNLTNNLGQKKTPAKSSASASATATATASPVASAVASASASTQNLATATGTAYAPNPAPLAAATTTKEATTHQASLEPNSTQNMAHKAQELANNDSMGEGNGEGEHESHSQSATVNDFDLSKLDPTLFADLFDDDLEEPHFNPEDGTYEPAIKLDCFKATHQNFILKLYHPLLFTWFKGSKSQHPLVLERMMHTLMSFSLGEQNVIGLFDQIQMVKQKEPLSYKLSKLSTVLEAMDIKTIASYQDYLSGSYLLDHTTGKANASSGLLAKLALPLRDNLIVSVHNNAKLYHELYNEPCDHSAINLLCAHCVPCYFAIKRTDLITTNQNSSADPSSLNSACDPLSAQQGVPSHQGASAQQDTSDLQGRSAGMHSMPHEQPWPQGQVMNDGAIFSATSSVNIQDLNNEPLSDEDMVRLIEFFIEDFTNYAIAQGYQYSMHLLGYALNRDYIFIDVLSFDFKLCLHALSSYLVEYYPNIVSLQASLLVKGTVSSTIDFIKEH